ncbi:CPBP family intramembrane glutamic endopeptidase [Nocardia jiangxiensis]|uniref:CPBP family intramembrane glutamic endopeptidase n=1 Tax=Nocardia jiangxiensis TaxID=282685 RepID=A0ABW6S105_9NOCA
MPVRIGRFAVVGAVVAANIALGFALHLGTDAYLLLGIPFTLLFPLVLQRRPIRELWVRDEHPPRIDARVLAIFVVLLIYPTVELVRAVADLITHIEHGGPLDWAVCGYFLVTIPGALAAAWSLRALGRDGWRRALRCTAVAGGTGVLLTLYNTVGFGMPFPSLWPGLLTFAESMLLYVPVVFVMEEVFFRGALDSYLHRPGEPVDGCSAVGLSILWALWHLPVMSTHTGIVRTIILALPLQVLIGVPLSLWWRRSGNLAVPGLAHAFNDAVRQTLLYGH